MERKTLLDWFRYWLSFQPSIDNARAQLTGNNWAGVEDHLELSVIFLLQLGQFAGEVSIAQEHLAQANEGPHDRDINHLTEQQTDQLFRLVKAEPFELTRGISGDWDPAFWGPQEDIDAHLMKISESNQRILQQAGGFLSPEQLDALNTLLNNSINERLAQAAAFIRKP